MTPVGNVAGVPGNAHVKLRFDSQEPLPSGYPRQMAFRIVQTDEGYSYRSYDDASRFLVQQVRDAGFQIDEQTLKTSFEKSDWSGGFGAYQEKPGSNRPSFTIGVDHRKKYPTLAPRLYTAGLSSAQDALPARISAIIEFQSNLYVQVVGRQIYKLGSWAAPGAAFFTLVHTHTNANATGRDLVILDNILYAGYGSTAAYAYSADGTTWVESNRGGNDQYAEAWLVLNGMLHKTRTNHLHSQTSSGINGGEAWASEDEIGDSTGVINEILGLNNNAVFAKEEGIFSLDAYGNTMDLYPELQTSRDPGNGWHAITWHNTIIYPTFWGELFAIKEGNVFSITPALQQERVMEAYPAENGVFIGRVRAMYATSDYLYVEVKRPTFGHRILIAEEIAPGSYRWRTLDDLPTNDSDEMYVSSIATSGPVLWMSTGSEYGYRLAYYILAAGPDPLQDTRSRYDTTGVLYEPWLDMGCPTIKKRWDAVEFVASGTGKLQVIAYDDDNPTNVGINRIIELVGAPITSRFRFKKTFRPLRIEIQFTFYSTSDTKTPVLHWYRVEAFPLPEPVRMFEFAADVPAAGVSWGFGTQIEMRQFVDRVRKVKIPLHFTDPWGDTWSVLPVPPAPTEETPSYVESGWNEYITLGLIEHISREFEIEFPPPADVTPPPDTGGDDYPPPPESWPGEGGCPAEGWVSGVVQTSKAPKIAISSNLGTSSVWSLLGVTGLPTNVGNCCRLRVDPWELSRGVKAGILLVGPGDPGTPNDETGSRVYKASVLSATTTWSLIFDVGVVNTILGKSYTEDTFFIDAAEYTIAEDGYIGVLYSIAAIKIPAAQTPARRGYAHSHDRGVTWTNVDLWTSASLNPGTASVRGLLIGQHNSSIIYASGARSPFARLYKSIDGGHTFTLLVIPSTAQSSFDFWSPYTGNDSEDLLYYLDGVSGAGTKTHRSRDGGVSWEHTAVDLYGTDIALGGLAAQVAGWNPSLWYIANRGGIGKYERSDDALATIVDLGTPFGNYLYGRDRMAILRPGALMTAHYRSTTPHESHVYCSSDWITFTEFTGDLNTVAPDLRLVTLVPNWTT